MKKLWDRWGSALAIALIGVGIVLNGHAAIQWVMRNSGNSFPTALPTITFPLQLERSPTPSKTATPTPSSTPSSTPSLEGETKFGHFPYKEGDENQMTIVGSYAQKEYQRFEKLAPEAGLALMKLIYAARDDGVWIIPVSGFRTVAKQETLFKEQIKRRGSAEAAAKVSAPPGYSEHHTGYALDVADGRFPQKDVVYEFAKTDAFRWLNRRAKEFGFELSFPEKNRQGVSYEPWHWRYIGSPEALAIFKRARQ